MKVSDIFFAVMTVTWVSVIGWAIWPIEPPIVYLPGDKVTPAIVKPGGVITIHRNIQVHREQQVTVIRTMVQGDCSQHCETVDLPSSSATLQVTPLRAQTREVILPKAIDAGEWRIVYAYEWKDRIGRVHSEPIPVLTFTVVE